MEANKMNGKKFTTLRGTLMYPPLVGGRAIIFHCGKMIRTSPIVAIHSASAEAIRFETVNTHYTLLTNPSPQPSDNSCMSLAA